MAGQIGISPAGFVAASPVIALIILLVFLELTTLALAAGLVSASLFAVVLSALHGVYVATLSRYATAGAVVGGFDDDLIREAFRRR